MEHPRTSAPLGADPAETVFVTGTNGCVELAAGRWPVGPDTSLAFSIFPLRGSIQPYGATYACVDVVFEDGTRLSNFTAVDQYGFSLTARAQGESKALYVDQWNRVSCHLGKWAAGLIATSIVVELDSPLLPAEPASLWISDIQICQADETPVDAVDFVDTRRGSNSTPMFSRGNTFPATAVPNGFTLASPMTDRSRDWFYSWSRHNTAEGRTPFAGVVLSHEPSPWMGDRAALTVQPSWGGRPETFGHDREHARPYSWSADLDSGAAVTISPSDHGAIVEFTGSAQAGSLTLLIGSAEGACRVNASPGSQTISGWVQEGSGLSTGHSRLFFYGAADRPWSAVTAGSRGPALLAVDGTEQTLRVATSFISLGQARHAYDLELARVSPARLRDQARHLWSERLEVLELPEATADEKVSAYSSLYRVNLYPTSQTENLGTLEAPQPAYASPVLAHDGETTDTQTGAAVCEGELYVNHGFWDTYRTVWPLYALIYPEHAARLADGFVEFARTGGWIPRWASPGYADLMPGTSSDVAFADLWVKGVPLPDPWAAYQAGLRNATALSTEPGVGRRDQAYRFLPFPTADLPEAVAWAAEAGLGDAALAGMAQALSRKAPSAKERDRLRSEARYLERRSLSYRNGFDSDAGFFRSHQRAGERTDEQFDPLAWGGDYTETNAWDYAFLAPHDGRGLAELYGGPDRLRDKLDQYFQTPEDADRPGTYGQPIHEMLEAREVRMGQFGMSNQPAHHIPFMYHHASSPDRASRISREVLRRLFRGSSIGQGYPGDEDNGEMSAWYLFALSGLYPLHAGSPNYVLTAPGTPHVVWHLPEGDLNIRAEADGPFAEATVVESLAVNDQPHTQSWIGHPDLQGGTRLDYRLTDQVGDWASAPSSLPPAIGDGLPGPWVDLTDVAIVTASGMEADSATRLIDNVGGDGDGARVHRGSSITFELPEPASPAMLTVTCGQDPLRAPKSWRFQTSSDGRNWADLAVFVEETFTWPGQLRPFSLPQPPQPERWFRLVFETEDAYLAQVELLA